MPNTVAQRMRRWTWPSYAAVGVVAALIVALLANWGGGTGSDPAPSAPRLAGGTATPAVAPTAPLPPPTFAPPSPPAVPPSPTPVAPPRVGLQVGHWHIADLPDPLARLRSHTGTAAAGRTELQLNLDVARRAAALLQAAGVQVDLLPATVPDGYQADAFVAIHADGNLTRVVRGYKVAPPWRSGVAWADAALSGALQAAYSTATGLPRDPGVTDNMRGYYAINGWMGSASRISETTPGAVIETGFMTSAADRAVLFAHPERVAAGVADGILAFLQSRADMAAEQQQAALVAAHAPTGCSAVVLLDDVPLRAAPNPNAPAVAWVNRGTVLPYLDSTSRPRGPFTETAGRRLAVQTGYYRVSPPDGGAPVYINRATVVVQLPPP